jgi:hypothetical protein
MAPRIVTKQAPLKASAHLGWLYKSGHLAPLPHIRYQSLQSEALRYRTAATIGRVARISNQSKYFNPFKSLTDRQALRLGGDVAAHIRSFEDGWDEQDAWLAMVMS